MQRRTFLRSGISAGVVGLGGLGFTRRPLAAAPMRSQAGPIRLSSNENPLGISPAGRQAILDGLAGANRYPRLRGELTEALATKHRVAPDAIVLGAGSTEILRMAVQAFTTPRGRLILADPTYEDTGFYARPLDLEVTKVPLRPDMTHDLAAMREAAEAASGPVCVYLCNPNNPTGTLTPSAAVDEWIRSAPEHVRFLVDEAYFDYVDDPDYWTALSWLPAKPNVLVVRTFSKVYGMAGVRLGYGIAHPATAESLRALGVRNNANHFALVAGLASLGEQEFVRRSLRTNREGKDILYACLRDLELESFPSHTNFVMHRINGDLRRYIRAMRDRGILVGRPFPPMLSHSRVSVGLPEEMERLTEALRACRREGLV